MSAIGVVAELDSPERLLSTIETLRARGYRLLDAYTPYTVKGVDAALGLRRSPINFAIFMFGLFGAAFAFWLQWLANKRIFPLNIGERPQVAIPAFVIIAFETMVLFASVAAFVALFWVCRLPRLSHPLFRVEGFESASADRFWVGVSADDPAFDPEGLYEQLQQLGALRVEVVR
jgi:hypothetical protein